MACAALRRHLRLEDFLLIRLKYGLPLAAFSSASALRMSLLIAMKVAALIALIPSVVAVHSHEGHDHDLQMPLDYVRFPYQARYPGDDEGDLRSIGTPRPRDI